MRVSEMPSGARGDLAVTIFRPDIKTLASLAGQIS
jgi:heavy metal efflux system protein